MFLFRRAVIAGLFALAILLTRGSDAGAQLASAQRVNEYLTYDGRVRTARLSIVASLDASNNALNYNGMSEGGLEIEVPLGWKVQVNLVNAGELHHSALVIKREAEPPIVPANPVFRGSSIEPADVGIVKSARDSMTFVAERAGTYALVCGVPAHAQLGMWIRFTVSGQAKAPGYRALGTHANAGATATHGK